MDSSDCSEEAGGSKPGMCAVTHCAEIVSGKWTLLVVNELAQGTCSFSDLEHALPGISSRTLCSRLEMLAENGLVERVRIKALPPRTQYSLTPSGELLLPLIDAMRTAGHAIRERQEKSAAFAS